MKFLPFAVVVATLAILLTSPETASAKGGKGMALKPSKHPTPVPEKVNASGAKITKVGGNSITVEYSKTSTTYTMSNETLVTIDGNRSRPADLKPGMHAEVTASNLTRGLLLSIQASSNSKH